MNGLLQSDFRSYDPRLVQVLPGREVEAVEFAVMLHRRGECDGIFVQNKEIDSWEFLRHVGELEYFRFNDVSSSFKKIDFQLLSGAKKLGIGGITCNIDFSIFRKLTEVGYQWAARSTGFEQMGKLRVADFWGIGSSTNAMPLRLSRSVEVVRLVRYAHAEIDFDGTLSELEQLSVSLARPLQRIPALVSLKKLELSCVGRSSFDYASIPKNVEELDILSCAPIGNWNFLVGMRNLRRLVVDDTPCPILPRKIFEALPDSTNVSLPASAYAAADLGFLDQESR